jgi:GNAT superfamily N-acetyltransferase
MRIEELARHPALIDLIAATLHASWGGLPPWVERGRIRERLVAGASNAAFPHTLLAITEDGQLAGTGSAKLFELPTHSEKVHWIGEIFVLPEHRGNGLGSRITNSLSSYAFSNGVSQLFLYTPDQQSLYARMGWKQVSQERIHNEVVSIMVLAGDV